MKVSKIPEESCLTRAAFSVALLKMKMKFLLASLAGAVVVVTGCVRTVDDTHTLAVPFVRDSMGGRYQRSVDEVYQAAVAVINHNGVVLTEFIPHDSTNSVRSLYGKVDQRKVWVRVEAVDLAQPITQVDVEARSTWGGRDLDLTHELAKEIALQLQSMR